MDTGKTASERTPYSEDARVSIAIDAIESTKPTPAEIERNRAIAKAEDEARADMATSIDGKIINPFGLLAGLLTTVHDEDEGGFSMGDAEFCRSVGNLLGLMVHGARKELEIQRVGGYGAYTLMQLLEKHHPEPTKECEQ